MCGGGNDASGEIRAQSVARQQAIEQGMGNIERVFSGFTPDFYEGVRGGALSTLMPQLGQQFRQARNSLVGGFSDRGLMRSSAARTAGTNLEYQKGLGTLMVANQANEQVANLKRNVALEKQNLVSQLVSSQDPTIAAQQAVSAAASLRAPSFVAPLGDFFSTLTNAYIARQVGKMAPTQAVGDVPSGKNYYRH